MNGKKRFRYSSRKIKKKEIKMPYLKLILKQLFIFLTEDLCILVNKIKIYFLYYQLSYTTKLLVSNHNVL